MSRYVSVYNNGTVELLLPALVADVVAVLVLEGERVLALLRHRHLGGLHFWATRLGRRVGRVPKFDWNWRALKVVVFAVPRLCAA